MLFVSIVLINTILDFSPAPELGTDVSADVTPASVAESYDDLFPPLPPSAGGPASVWAQWNREPVLASSTVTQQDSVLKAKKELLTNFQQQASSVISIPKEHHRYIVGKGGKNVKASLSRYSRCLFFSCLAWAPPLGCFQAYPSTLSFHDPTAFSLLRLHSIYIYPQGPCTYDVCNILGFLPP